jgi:tripartite-type tricarboxylate transporter receptor subunit TctC
MYGRRKAMIWKKLAPTLIAWIISFAPAAHAQSWPTKLVRLVVPQSPGSNIDLVARALANQMQVQTGQPFIIENRAGAGSTLGPAAVAKASADGYTLLVAAATMTIAPSTVAQLPFDITRDFAAVLPLTNTPLTLVAPPGKYSSVAELVAAGRGKQGALNYASVGFGSASHFMGERLGLAGGFHAEQIPFRGTMEGMADIMSGRVDFFFAPLTTTQSLILEHKLDGLAVTSSARVPAVPQIPTMREAGYPEASFDMWVGVFAPRAVDETLLRTMHQEMRKALTADAVRTQLTRLGGQPMAEMTSDEFAQLVANEIVRNASIAKAAGITPK